MNNKQRTILLRLRDEDELRRLIALNAERDLTTAIAEHGSPKQCCPASEQITGSTKTRDLLYHVCPLGPDTWRNNIRNLLKRIKYFNGKRIVAVFTGDSLAPLLQVQGEFKNERIDEWVIMPNNVELRETFSFIPMLLALPNEPNRIAFYAHTKGVTRDRGAPVHRWTEIMYETCLDYLPYVETLLNTSCCAGSFKKLGRGFPGSRSTWHYSGTFFWFRNQDVFARKWTELDRSPYGVESWISLLFNASEAACIFHQGTVPDLNLYSWEVMQKTIEPQYKAWRQAMEQYRNCLWTSSSPA